MQRHGLGTAGPLVKPIERQMAVMTTPWVREAMSPAERTLFDGYAASWARPHSTTVVSLLAERRGGPFVGRMRHPVDGREIRVTGATLPDVLRRLIAEVDGVTA